MQRMLVALVLGLLIAVAYLGLSLADVSSQVEQERLARNRELRDSERRGAERDEKPDPGHLSRLERKLRGRHLAR